MLHKPTRPPTIFPTRPCRCRPCACYDRTYANFPPHRPVARRSRGLRHAQTVTTQADDTATTQPAATQPTANTANTADAWLDRIEQRAQAIDTLHAQLRYERVQGLLGDRQIRFGDIFYEAGSPKRFAIHFDRIVLNNQLQQRDKWYIFDGHWLAERDHAQKVFIRRELVPPGKQGEQMLDLENSPFVVPLDLKKQSVLERFEVTLVPDGSADGANNEEDKEAQNTVHLRLTPRPKVDVDYQRHRHVVRPRHRPAGAHPREGR